MNLLEAIQGAGENWFRSIGWHGSAFYVHRPSGLIHKESKVDGDICKFPLFEFQALGEWEIVTPEQVLSERKL